MHPPLSEIAKRLKTRDKITFTRENVFFEFSRIKASQARDYDGTPANWPESDDRRPIQRVTTRLDSGKTTYTNYW